MHPRRIDEIAARLRGMAPGSAIDHRAKVISSGPISLANAGWVVVLSTIALCLIGIYCIDLASGLRPTGLARSAGRQLIFLALGLGVATAVAWPHYRRFLPYTWVMAVGVLALLVFVLIPWVPESIVRPKNGARRWIDLRITEFQPSELAKVVFILVLASYLRYRRNHRSLRGLVGPGLIALVPMAFIVVEPDLGTATLFMPTLLAMLVAAGAKLKHLISAATLGAIFAVVIAVASLALARADKYPLLREHQVERIQAVVDQFTGDERHVQDRGFQGRQAMTLVGAGGLNGHDAAHARALIHFSALPERHNDMIFAVLVNRFGLLGALAVLGLYGAWILGALVVAGACKDPFGRLIAVGCAAMVGTQMAVNVGMTIGILPITGMTLPFFSYGGSSLIVGWIMVGLICNVGLRRPEYLWRRSFEFDDELGS